MSKETKLTESDWDLKTSKEIEREFLNAIKLIKKPQVVLFKIKTEYRIEVTEEEKKAIKIAKRLENLCNPIRLLGIV